MKKQVRRGIFETNSSSVHSLVMCMESDYDKWDKGETLLFTGSAWGYPENNRPLRNHFYTKEEAIAFEKSSKYPPDEDFDWNDDENVMEMLHENEWRSSEDFWDDRYGEFEHFKDTMTTPNGDTVVAFGYYGYDA